jgi:hypothetical protein
MRVETVNREMFWPRATDVISALMWMIVALFFMFASVYVPA